jgi:malonyl-CoA/methylmalonyl-CoA synthetase
VASLADRVAIRAGGRAFSYRELDEASRQVGEALRAGRSALDDARVAFLIPPSFAHVAVQHGIWRAGGVAVPLGVSHPAAELAFVVRDADAAIVVADPAFTEMLAPTARAAGARFVTTDTLLARTSCRAPEPTIDPSRRAMILYTSGTTGQPKGVVTTHANIAAQVASLVEAWEWTSDDRALLALPLHHVHGIINVVSSALAAGATCEMLPAFDAAATWSRLASGDISIFTAVPTIYHRLIASWNAAPPDEQRRRSEGCRLVRVMMSGSAALPRDVLERWREISGHTLLERYGMTEFGMALSNPLHGDRRAGYVGTPLPRVSVRLVDEHGVDVSAGVAGEIEVRGPGMFTEYWHRPDETRGAFHDGWFRTGDLAIVEDGAYRILGRLSVDIIKTGGEKISALEIEEVLRSHPAIADCAIVGVPDDAWGARVSVAAVLRPGVTLSIDDLQAWARARLAPAKVPKAWLCVDALPRNAMGKVVKTQVVALFEHG